jgi:hypothetical protein
MIPILLVGMVHMARPGADLASIDPGDITTPERQRQIEEVVECLSHFRPTKVAVEVVSSAQAKIDGQYEAYRRGEFTLPPSESYQIGFRLAAAAGLPSVACVDEQWADDVYGDAAGLQGLLDSDADAKAVWEGFVERLQEWAAHESDVLRRSTVREFLVRVNTEHIVGTARRAGPG